jgi:predicted nucleic acid-binding protein
LTTSSTGIEPIYVVDTHVLIWYLSDSRKLSQQATAIFAAAERGETRLYIPVVVMAEMYYANKKWGFFEDFHSVYSDMQTKPYFRFVPFLADDVLDFDIDAAIQRCTTVLSQG